MEKPRSSQPRKTTRRVPGAWNVASLTAERVGPESRLAIAWLPPEKFRVIIHQAGAESGFGSQNDVKRPDIVVVERDLALDRKQTSSRLISGTLLGILGLAVFATEFTVFPIESVGLVGFFTITMVGAGLAVGGLTIATESRWQSEIIRVRLDPASTRVSKAADPSVSRGQLLDLRLFEGRVSSTSSSAQSGTFRRLVGVLAAQGASGSSGEFASRLMALASLEAGNATLETGVRTVSGAAAPDHNLVPQESNSKRPVWYDYPPRFNWIRVFALLVPMMLLIWGPMLLVLPTNFQHVSYVEGSSPVQSLAVEPWSPTGSTTGDLYWETYNAVSGAVVEGVTIQIALCPGGATAIGPSCHAPINGPTGPAQGHVSVSIPNDWHLVTSVNTSALCQQCKSYVSLDSPATGWGLGLTLAGIAVVVPASIGWIRLRARVRSSWPG